MVSDDTHDRTQDMLEKGGWFGMEEGQVTLMKQEKVAAIQVSAFTASDFKGSKLFPATKTGNPFGVA